MATETWVNEFATWASIVRDLGIVAIAPVGLYFAYKRLTIADRQAHTSEENLDWVKGNAPEERFQKAIDDFASTSVRVRLSAVWTLSKMAQENPTHYHVRVIMLFAAFLADLPTRREGNAMARSSADTLEIMKELNNRTEKQRQLEVSESFHLHERLAGTAFEMTNGQVVWRKDQVGSNPVAPSPSNLPRNITGYRYPTLPRSRGNEDND